MDPLEQAGNGRPVWPFSQVVLCVRRRASKCLGFPPQRGRLTSSTRGCHHHPRNERKADSIGERVNHCPREYPRPTSRISAAVLGGSKDQTRQSAPSPDGRFVAELHTVITPMHGGPDTFYVAIRGKNDAFGETVFSRVYECDDTDGFNIRWTGAEELNVSSGECNTGHPEDDRINTKQVVWRGVAINYLGTHHTATR
jgi:hypothetical protein